MKDLIMWFVPESITYGLESVMVEVFRGCDIYTCMSKIGWVIRGRF
jgi:hypothetical protein